MDKFEYIIKGQHKRIAIQIFFALLSIALGLITYHIGDVVFDNRFIQMSSLLSSFSLYRLSKQILMANGIITTARVLAVEFERIENDPTALPYEEVMRLKEMYYGLLERGINPPAMKLIPRVSQVLGAS